MGQVDLVLSGGKAEIRNLFVKPEYRQQSVGSGLVQRAIQLARTRGVPAVSLLARSAAPEVSSTALIGMYRKLGFQVAKTTSKGPEMMLGSALQAKVSPTVPPRVPVRGLAQSVGPGLRNEGTSRRPTRPVIQRALNRGLSVGTLDDMALALNQARTGEADTRNTQAIAFGTGGTYTAFTQREYNVFDESITELEADRGITIDERVIGDSRDDEGIHAEMLAVSEWLVGNQEKPKRLGVSQAVCARCQKVLDILNIDYGNADGHFTKNWVHPLRHAANARTANLSAAVILRLKALPQKVTRGREYGWT